MAMPAYSTVSSFAEEMDEQDPLRRFREEFHFPRQESGKPVRYFCGNSLGLQPRRTQEVVGGVLDDWARLGVEGHFDARPDWYSYHEIFRERGARVVGAHPDEVVMMNSLTTNLHLMMVSFFRPTKERYKIVIESGAFPSDTYAVKSQLHFHGLDPKEALIALAPQGASGILETEAIEEVIEAQGDRIALFLLSGVQYRTGQFFDMARITAKARDKGCRVGWDLAHAAGNVPLSLHDWNVDFAVWCSYKYLNAGPGAVAGCFVHRRHGNDPTLPRFAGWWGNDPSTRFSMHLLPDFEPTQSADAWQLSNPPILALAPLSPSLDLFEEAGMEALREKSVALTGYLEFLLDELGGEEFTLLTPRDPEARGCQISLEMKSNPKERLEALRAEGIVCDFRGPNVIRVAPVPLYNGFVDVREFVRVLTRAGS